MPQSWSIEFLFVYLSKTLKVIKCSSLILWLRKLRVKEVEYMPKVVELAGGHVVEHRNLDYPFDKETLPFLAFPFFIFSLTQNLSMSQ